MLTRRHGGFRLGRKLLSAWRWALCHRPRRRNRGYLRLQPCPSAALLSPRKQQQHDDVGSPRMLTWGRSLARRMKLLAHKEPAEATTPKGQVAVYVGGPEPGESMRYVVPVVYFNHPLFGELLREAEEEFGFEHPGGITIPCAASRFERAAAVAAARGKKVPGWW